MGTLVGGKRAAYTVIEAGHKPDGEPLFMAGLCVEGTFGFRTIPDYGPAKRARMVDIVTRLNERIGITDADAEAIVVSTFKRSPRSRRTGGKAR